MIKSFSVTNFKNFQNKVTLDFSKIGNYEFNDYLIKDGISKTSIMYGANASGKSSISLALFDIVANLTDNYISTQAYDNYLNANDNLGYAEFEYLFSFDGKEVFYKYKKKDLHDIISETLTIDGHQLVSYDKTIEDTLLSIELKGAEGLNKNLNLLKISALKYIASNTILDDTSENTLFQKLMAFVNKMLLFWNLQYRSFIGYTTNTKITIIEEILNKNHFEDLVDFFKKAGFKDKLVHNAKTGKEELYIEYSSGKQIEFSEVASTGMSSLLLLYCWLEDIANIEIAPSFVCIDEFDAFYHYKLSRFVVEKLGKADVQVFLTTHNTALMSNFILRPDSYFICKDGKINNLNNLTEKEIRQGNNLEKLYRGEIFG